VLTGYPLEEVHAEISEDGIEINNIRAKFAIVESVETCMAN